MKLSPNRNPFIFLSLVAAMLCAMTVELAALPQSSSSNRSAATRRRARQTATRSRTRRAARTARRNRSETPEPGSVGVIIGTRDIDAPPNPDEPPPPADPGEPPPPGSASQTPRPRNVINGGVLNGKAISKPAPPYPPIAKAARAQGTVTVQIVVDEEGRVISAQAISGHPL